METKQEFAQKGAGRSVMYLLGVNYWSRSGALFMWEKEFWDPGIVDEEVSSMKSLGMNCCRSFIFSPTFMREPNRVDEEHLDRFDHFLRICEKHDFCTIPTFIVGHMSGQNWDFPFRNGRDLYSDKFMLEQQCLLVKRVVERCCQSQSVLGYLLSNEMPLYAGDSSVEDVAGWASSLIRAIRFHDPEKPVGIGDGCWNAFGGNNGFDLSKLSGIVDFFGPHMYISEPDTYRHAMITDLLMRYCKRYGLPVIMEEFGASSSHASDDAVALYYDEVFFNTFMAGGKGNLAWCLNDFQYTEIEPYVHHPFELRFGVLDDTGKEKPAADRFGVFREFLSKYECHEPVEAQAAIVVPKAYNEKFPFSREDYEEQRRAFLQCAVLAAKAGFSVDFVDEDLPASWEEYKLLLLPCSRRLLAKTWGDLLEFASKGGAVYWSYYAGSSPVQQGTWMNDPEGFTGCRFFRRYGLPDLLAEDFEIHVEGDGWKISCDKELTVWDRSFLRLMPSDSVVSEKIGDNLWYVHRDEGRGKILFVNFPVEQLLSVQTQINDHDHSFLLYRKLATEADVDICYTDNPLIRVREVRSDNRKIVFLQNVSWENQEFSQLFRNGRKELAIEGYLGPKEARAL